MVGLRLQDANRFLRVLSDRVRFGRCSAVAVVPIDLRFLAEAGNLLAMRRAKFAESRLWNDEFEDFPDFLLIPRLTYGFTLDRLRLRQTGESNYVSR